MTTAPADERFDEHGHPAWRIAGPLGVVTYRSLGNVLYLEPLGSPGTHQNDHHADEVKILATTGSDQDVLGLLRTWYAHLPDMPGFASTRRAEAEARLSPQIARWRALRGPDLTAAIAAARWYAHEDDTIGGWCVTVVDSPPSSGAPNVGSFLGEQTARHVVLLHNNFIDTPEGGDTK